ncbi:diguanylate cyclase domain-containing protein [Inhella gelatinilytica]|uniref:GGDEF domain-containing protein n=1 Tax=Inhella gelatinilytica TaxID=2795030 RepID=A0A931IVN9_9BURK|nr:diguanylate cyclase [Inhella gelatinilytica]MBH9553675.1 GGDEF domain-containing protein [Inhella gelatinilytica]
MKLGLTGRLGVVMAFVGVLAAGLTGYYGYVHSRRLVLEAAEQRLATATRVLARQVSVGLKAVAADVLLMAEHPVAAQLLMRTEPQYLERAQLNTGLLFERMLLTHPEYFQMRLIDAQSHGVERVRVDRSGGTVHGVAADDLQEKGHTIYVREALRLPRGAVYVSPVVLNRDVGAAAEQGQPSIQVAAPVVDVRGVTRGVMVVSVDLKGLFTQLAADLPRGLDLYLLNGAGDYLIHPDTTKVFAFERGQRANAVDDYPDVANLLREGAAQAREQGSQTATGLAAFVRQPTPELHQDAPFIIGLSQSLDEVLEQAQHLRDVIGRVVIGFSLFAVLLAVMLARAWTQPLKQILRAVRGVTAGNTLALPTGRRDEFGVLARAVVDMQRQIGAQMEALRAKQDELNLLASSDALTGLVNRRVFMDRLEHALVQARRHHQALGLLFIDLDGFKAINDQHGHAAGDAVLQTVARRLTGLVREADTVARLGGDEFVILVDGEVDGMSLELVQSKVQAVLDQPVAFAGLDLPLGASIGEALYPLNGESPGDLLAAADGAMYRAKQVRKTQTAGPA